MGKQYTVSDGEMMLILEEAEEGGFVVTSPIDPGLVTQADTLQEAFRMAHDAAQCLAIGRRLLAERLGLAVAEPAAGSPPTSKPRVDRDRAPSRGKRTKGLDVP